MRWLEKTEEWLNDNFSNPQWGDDLNSDGTIDTFKSKLKEKEQDTLKSTFEFLNFSVLEGEYIQDTTKFNDILKSIYNKVGNLQSILFNTDDDIYTFSRVFEEEQFLYSLKIALDFYSRIVDHITKQINNPHKTIVLDISDTFEGTSKYFSKKDDILSQSLFDLFYENLNLARTGFFLENYTSEFKYFIETKDTVKKLKTKINVPDTNFPKIIDILVEICTFYQRKIILRIGQDEKRFNEKYIFNLEEFDFSLQQHELNEKYFKEWDTYSQNHFYSETSQEKRIELRKDILEVLKNEFLVDSSFLKIHRLIKYFKDLNPNLYKLEELLAFFTSFKPKNEYDKFAVNVSTNYLKNNILSYKIEESDIFFIDDLILEYKQLQEESLINNFFPYYKICTFLKAEIQNKISSENLDTTTFLNNLSAAELAFKNLKSCFDSYKENFKWSESHLYYAYQLPFEESIVKVAINETTFLNIFIPSTFSLSIDYSKYNDFFREIEYFLLNLQNEINSLKSLSKLTTKLVEKENAINAELKDQAKKNVELLGIFSAIIALLFTGVTTAQSMEKFELKLMTFISMFIVLISFLLLLHYLTNHKKKN